MNATAGVVSSSKALSVAREFMDASNLTLVWDGNDVLTKASDAPVFYVYNISGGGWVIVSGDDCTTPILGYSDTGSFEVDDMPSNLKGWLGAIREDILSARVDKAQATAEVKKLWSNPRPVATKASAQKVLTTAQWSQGNPFNMYIKDYVTDSNGNPVTDLVTGCVATAMAIVLKYHGSPTSGTGTIGGYVTDRNKYNVGTVELGHTYNWESMPDILNSNSPETQRQAVAQLMLECGLMVHMDYIDSSYGSSAYSEDILPALTEHMGYSKAATLKYKANYSSRDWMQMVMTEIDGNRPVLYGGSGNAGGHQFVCDGYDADNNTIHINWGWYGNYNGYFTTSLYISGRNMSFDEGQDAIFGLKPAETGESEPGQELCLTSLPDFGYGFELASGTVEKGSEFVLYVGAVYQGSGSDYEGTLAIAHVDKYGNNKEFIGSATYTGDHAIASKMLYKPGFGCRITEDIEFGDRLALWYQTGTDSWAPALVPKEDLSYPWEYACFDVCAIKTKKTYSAGEVFDFTIIPGNTGISSIAWKYDGASTQDDYVVLTSGTHTITAQVNFVDDTSETITQVISVQ